MKRVKNDNQIRSIISIRSIRSSFAVTAAAVLTSLGLLAGCAQTAAPAAPGSEEQAPAEAGAVQAAEETAPEGTEAAQEAPEIDEQALSADLTIRVGMLKNPGAFGLVAVMDAQEASGETETQDAQEVSGEAGTPEEQEAAVEAEPEADQEEPEAGREETETSREEPEAGREETETSREESEAGQEESEATQEETVASSNFILYDSMQELADQFRQEELDAAILPANIAAVLYQQTEGGVLAADLCTLNSLTCVTGSEDIHSVKDFAGRTVVMTGQGTAAEYSLKYLLKLCGIENCTILFASDGLEIAGLLRADPAGTIALLPEPFATVTVIGNDAVKPVFALTEEWEALAGGRMPGNVLAVRKSYAEENAEELAKLLSAHEAGTFAAQADPEATAQRIARYGMIDKATVAREALPQCRLVCASGEEMKNVLSGYLEALYSVNESSVGGELPGDDFYYEQ
ncbi:MAG: ABC transporter substrate-binding protein [Lachnospiraceae bacterium]|nr:ABC transporter substrate-binding protein [Lachnospiraceae bacterium]